jgi:hypothetical protein
MQVKKFLMGAVLLGLATPGMAAFKMSKPKEVKKAPVSTPAPQPAKTVKVYRKTRHYKPAPKVLITNGCATDMVCASNPASVADSLRLSGYVVIETKAANGNPLLASSTGDMPWIVQFDGCTNGTGCDVIEFIVSFEATGKDTAKLTNLWNNESQFGRASATNKLFEIGLSVSTVGGLNRANFTDVVARWTSVHGDLIDFFNENPPKKYGIKVRPDKK